MIHLIYHWWLLLILREAPTRVFLLLKLLLFLFKKETGASYISFSHIGSFRRVKQSGRMILLLSTWIYGWYLLGTHYHVPGLPRCIIHLYKCIFLVEILSLVIDISRASACLDGSLHELSVYSCMVLVCNLGTKVMTRASLYSELMLDDVLRLTQVFYTRFALDCTCLRWN